MDLGDSDGGGFGDEPQKRALPSDLPKSLDDRKAVPTDLVQETEYYDGWQGPLASRCAPPHWLSPVLTCHACPPGQSQFLTSPILAKPLQFSDLTLDDPSYDADLAKGVSDSDTRLMEMLAAQAQHHGGDGLEDADAVADDDRRPQDEKKSILQKSLAMAASNGDLVQVKKILGGKAKQFVDVNAPDDEGTPPLIYASCFVCRTPPQTTPAGVAKGTSLIGTRATRLLCKP